jgi:hypothetical protein
MSTGTFIGVTLNTGPGNYFPVLSSTAAPATGTYYVNASVMVWVDQGDSAICQLRTLNGYVGVMAAAGPAANATWQTIPLVWGVSLTAGQGVQVVCGDTTDDDATFFYDGSMTATLINNPGTDRPSMTTRRPPLSPRQ